MSDQGMTIEALYRHLQEDGYEAILELPEYPKLLEQAAQGSLHTPITEPRIIIQLQERTVVITLTGSSVTDAEYASLLEQLQDT